MERACGRPGSRMGTPSPIPGPGSAISPGTGWTRSSADVVTVACDFENVGHDSMVILNNRDAWIGVLDWTGEGLPYTRGAKGSLTGPGGTWPRMANDTVKEYVNAGDVNLYNFGEGPAQAELQWQGPELGLQVIGWV